MKIARYDEPGVWINPWNDRRPMTDDWVLVTIIDGTGKYVSIARFADEWEYIDEDQEIAAWMPLPEPADVCDLEYRVEKAERELQKLVEEVKAYVRDHYDGEEKEELPLEQA